MYDFTMKLLVKIESISKEITNSSSEVFLVKSKRPAEDIKELISSYAKMAFDDGKIEIDRLSEKSKDIVEEDKLVFDNDDEERSGGMGGYIDVVDYEDAHYQHKRRYYEDVGDDLKKYNISKDEIDHYVLVDIDNRREKTISFINDNFTSWNCEMLGNSHTEEDDKLYNIYSILSCGLRWYL